MKLNFDISKVAYCGRCNGLIINILESELCGQDLIYCVFLVGIGVGDDQCANLLEILSNVLGNI